MCQRGGREGRRVGGREGVCEREREGAREGCIKKSKKTNSLPQSPPVFSCVCYKS